MDPDLLVSADVTSTSPQTVVYKIKPDAVWNDGTPVTADDFIYNWQTMDGVHCADCSSANTSGYDQINVAGTVTLAGNFNLNLAGNFTPRLNETFTVIQGTQPISGTFAGLPEGAVITIGAIAVLYFSISERLWKVAPGEEAPMSAKWVAALVLISWAGVIMGGRLIPYV